MLGRLSIVLIAAAACARDPAQWPPREIANFEASCPNTFGTARICPCYAKRASERIAWSRSKQFVAAADTSVGFEDVYLSLELVTRECSKDLPLIPWPRVAKANYLGGCLRGKDANVETCDCLFELAQKALTPEAFLAAGMGRKAGKDLDPDVQNVFASDEAVGCFVVSPDAGWPSTSRAKTVEECLGNPAIPAQLCPCFADEMMRGMTWAEMLRMAQGKDDGGYVEAKITRLAPGWMRSCQKRGKPKAKRR